MGSAIAANVRTVRLAALTGFCLGLGGTVLAGRPLVARVAALPVFRGMDAALMSPAPAVEGKAFEYAFLVVVAAAGAGLALLGALGTAASRGRTPGREGAILGGTVAAVLGLVVMPAGGRPAGLAPWLMILAGALTAWVMLAGRRGPGRRPVPPGQGGPGAAVRPATWVWFAIVAGLCWLHTDPFLRIRPIDQLHEGAHLAWVWDLAAGRLPGAGGVYMIYGPLYEYGLLGWMRMVGWSIVGERTFFVACQIAGGVCAFWVLTRLCRTVAGAVAGLAVFHVATVGALYWYGWANALRAGLGLVSLQVAVGTLMRGGRHPVLRAGTAGAGLAAAFCFSPDAGGAATIAYGMLAVAASADGPSRHGGIGRMTAVAAGWIGMVGLTLLVGYQGPLAARWHALIEFSTMHLGGFMAVPFPAFATVASGTWADWTMYLVQWTWLAWGAPWLCAAALVWVVAGRMAGARPGAEEWRIAGLGMYGLLALSTAMNRSDRGHILAASPAAVLLAAVAVERSLLFVRALTRSRSPRAVGLRRGYAAASGLAWVMVAGLVSNYSLDIWGSDETVLGSKRAATTVLVGDLVPGPPLFMNSRLAGLRLGQPQSGDLVRALALVDRWTVPGEPIFAGSYAEAIYFLADRPCPNRYPVSHHAATPEARREVVASLASCRVAVMGCNFKIDGMRWEEWQPWLAAALARDFFPVWRGSHLEVWHRK